MENTTSTILTLNEHNKQNMNMVRGPILYLVVLMVVGIPGNLTVLVIYRRKYSKSVYRMLIWNLALADFCFVRLRYRSISADLFVTTHLKNCGLVNYLQHLYYSTSYIHPT